MQVVILCGGLGTRLREETEFRPKPLIEIGQYPILWHIMKIYGHHGFTSFVLCLGYKGAMIKEYFLNYEALTNDVTVQLGVRNHLEYHGTHREQDYRVTLADTGLDTMTGGRIARIERFIEGDTFMLTYGDAVGDMDITALLAFHRAHGRIATVSTVRPPSRFGTLAMGHGAKVTAFNEKPRLGDWISAGFFVLDRRVFDYLGADDCVFETGPLERLAADDQLRAFQHEGVWYPMDTYRETIMLNEMWKQGTAAWRIWE